MNRQIVLARRVDGIPSHEDFRLVQEPDPVLPPGGVLAETVLLSVDPAMRGWVSSEANYMEQVAIGDVMRALGVARVIESDCAAWRPGDLFYGWVGWCDRVALAPERILWGVDPGLADLPAWISVLGLNGLTAIKGWQAFAQPRAGQTLLVSTAAGGVGSLVGQLGQRAGMRTIGLTSGATKLALATSRFGYDQALDYRARADLGAALDQACPFGIDLFWDHVGGAVADLVFPRLARGARIIQCGTASIPRWSPWPDGPRRERDMLTKRLSWHGFIALDGDIETNRQAQTSLRTMMAETPFEHLEEIVDGLEKAPDALSALYRGDNTGRICVRP
jgi:NADPH-dependent curcumin reductase CurA